MWRQFEYCEPESVEECCELLAQYGDEAQILAGGDPEHAEEQEGCSEREVGKASELAGGCWCDGGSRPGVHLLEYPTRGSCS